MRPIVGNTSSEGKKPGAPTIGAATAGNTSATVSFTPPTYTGKGGTVTYVAVSNPGAITGSSTSSPITVSGLTNGTSYTFSVRASTAYGVLGDSSSQSNSVTPTAPPFFPPDFTTTTTTTTAAPCTCAGVNCGGVPPGNGYVLTGTYQQCIQSICFNYIGNWEAYYKLNNCGQAVCCGYGLFVGCDYSNPTACPT